MDIFAIAAVVICAVIIAALLKRKNSEYALLLSLITVVMILAAALQNILPLVEEMQALADAELFGFPYLSVLLKAVGITIMAQAAAALCLDGGEKALAYAVETAGRAAILFLCLPVITGILGYIREILSL